MTPEDRAAAARIIRAHAVAITHPLLDASVTREMRDLADRVAAEDGWYTGDVIGRAAAALTEHLRASGDWKHAAPDMVRVVLAAVGPPEAAPFRKILAAVEEMRVQLEDDEETAARELSRLEDDMFEIHATLEDAGYDGAINAASIMDRIRAMSTERPRLDVAPQARRSLLEQIRRTHDPQRSNAVFQGLIDELSRLPAFGGSEPEA